MLNFYLWYFKKTKLRKFFFQNYKLKYKNYEKKLQKIITKYLKKLQKKFFLMFIKTPLVLKYLTFSFKNWVTEIKTK